MIDILPGFSPSVYTAEAVRSLSDQTNLSKKVAEP